MGSLCCGRGKYTYIASRAVKNASKCGSPLGPNWGWRHTRLRGRGWGPNSNEGTDTLVLYVNYDKAPFHVASKPHISG
jgi:hypothetical protein